GPVEMVYDQATQGWPDQAGNAPDPADHALVAVAFFTRARNIGHDGQDERENAARPQPLQTPEYDQHFHALGQAAGRRTGQEDYHGGHKDRLAPVKVGQLAVEGYGAGRGEQVNRKDPGIKSN